MIENITNAFSKESIKARMLQNAVKIWGVKKVSLIDPFVVLLIDAFSQEIFKASHEIDQLSSRILEKLSHLLTPSVYTCAQPAHAIACTYPKTSIEILPKHAEFFIQKTAPSQLKNSSDLKVNINFTPIDNIRLIKMNIDLMLTRQMAYKFDLQINKLPIAQITDFSIPHNKIILGIDATNYKEQTDFPDSIALYCENTMFESFDFILKLLPFIQAKANGKNLEIKSGLGYIQSYEDYQDHFSNSYEEIIQEHSIQKRIEDNIKDIYNDKFIQIWGLDKNCITTQWPDFLENIKIDPALLELVADKKMIWVELLFPPQYTAEIINNFSFALNAFPVYNRKWKTNEYKLKIIGDNIPLVTEIGEHFLFVDKICDSSGNYYKKVPFHENNNIDKGLYTVRKGGMERFSSINALDSISHVLDLTRDEISAFGNIDRDQIEEILQEMTSKMKTLNQRITQTEKTFIQNINYAIVNPFDQITNLKADYWVTQPYYANYIQSRTVFSPSTLNISNNNIKIWFLTESSAGSEPKKSTDAVQAFRYALNTRDRLITIDDIKNFCYFSFQKELDKVEVKRITIISDKPKEGFIRALLIEITPANLEKLGEKYWENACIELRKNIIKRGVAGVEYVIKIKNK